MTLMQNCYSVTKLWPTIPWRKTAAFTVVLKLIQGGAKTLAIHRVLYPSILT